MILLMNKKKKFFIFLSQDHDYNHFISDHKMIIIMTIQPQNNGRKVSKVLQSWADKWWMMIHFHFPMTKNDQKIKKWSKSAKIRILIIKFTNWIKIMMMITLTTSTGKEGRLFLREEKKESKFFFLHEWRHIPAFGMPGDDVNIPKKGIPRWFHKEMIG